MLVCFKGPGESFIGVLPGASHEILHCQNGLLRQLKNKDIR